MEAEVGAPVRRGSRQPPSRQIRPSRAPSEPSRRHGPRRRAEPNPLEPSRARDRAGSPPPAAPPAVRASPAAPGPRRDAEAGRRRRRKPAVRRCPQTVARWRRRRRRRSDQQRSDRDVRPPRARGQPLRRPGGARRPPRMPGTDFRDAVAEGSRVAAPPCARQNPPRESITAIPPPAVEPLPAALRPHATRPLRRRRLFDSRGTARADVRARRCRTSRPSTRTSPSRCRRRHPLSTTRTRAGATSAHRESVRRRRDGARGVG